MSLRKITVVNTEEIASGTGERGVWTLSKVTAVDEQGQPITETLKTFARLPTGKQIEVAVEKQDPEKYGVSYMLRLPKGSRMASLDERLARAEERLDALEARQP